MSLRHLPNLLCVLRMVLVLPVALWILDGRYPEVMALFALAAFTDALDGFPREAIRMDQRARQASRSARGQAAADHGLRMPVGRGPVALVAHCGRAAARPRDRVRRDLVYRALFGPLRGSPRFAASSTRSARSSSVSPSSRAQRIAWPTEPVITALGALVLVTTAVSGIDYVLIYTRRAAAVSRGRAAAAR